MKLRDGSALVASGAVRAGVVGPPARLPARRELRAEGCFLPARNREPPPGPSRGPGASPQRGRPSDTWRAAEPPYQPATQPAAPRPPPPPPPPSTPAKAPPPA